VLRRTLNVARAARRGLSVTIDARALGGSTVSGTQIYTVELVLALARSGRVRLRVVVPHDLSSFAARAFDSAPGIELLPYERATQGVELTDIVHRPQQVFTAADLALLRLLGQRIVVGQQDLIAYRDPAYHESAAVWWSYRRVTRLALAAADRVVFFSEHTRRDVIAEELLDAGRAEVTGIGGDAEAAGETGAAGEATAPSGAPGDGAFLACLGADYAHKNRPFAIALLEALNRRHGWSGRLVLAGASVPHGSSRGEERELLERWPALAERVTDVGPVDEAGRRWLYEHAAAVVYPSTYEGFGLVPFEAAAAGTPCLYAAQASLPELAGPEAATLVPWNPDASADAAIGLLADGPARQAHVSRLREAAAGKRWSEVTEHLLGAYERALRSPQRAGAPRAWQELERERYIATLGDDAEILKRSAVEYQEAFHDLNRRVGIALPLVDEGGLLSRDQQRGLMRIAARGLLRRLLLGPVGVLGRMGRDSPADRESPSE
jgi:glycosyltransferase involved in cell wall biosynthesis